MFRSRIRLLPAVFFLAGIFTIGCQAVTASPQAGYTVGQLQMFEDPGGSASIDQIASQGDQFQDVLAQTPSYLFSSSAYWFRLPVQNQRDQPLDLYLDVQNPLIDHLTLYEVDSGQVSEVVQSGDRLPAQMRPYPNSYTLALPFHLEGRASAELYLRVRTDASAMLVPMQVIEGDALRASDYSGRIFFGILIGLFGALFFYNLFAYWLLKQSSYLYYVLYLPFAFLTITALDGLGSAFLYPGNAGLGNEGLVVFSGMALALGLFFARAFLRTAEYPDLDRALKLMIGVTLFQCISPFLLPIGLTYQIDIALLFVYPLVCLTVGLAIWRRGRTEARFYVLGQAASWVGFLIFALFSCGVFPYSALIYETISIGVAVDALLLSLALADRIRILQREKLAAENLAHKNLQVRQEELQRLVAQRTSELESARRRAEVLATTDLLTNIYNRRGLLAVSERDVKLALRHQRPLSVVMFDLDHFKSVNDAYGHPVGDRVLCDVASTVRREIRNTDLFGRIGGEEFLLVLPDTSVETSLQLAERLRRCIAEDVAVGTYFTHITASFGVAQLGEGSTLESLMLEADHALYRAKANGRNRVELNDGSQIKNQPLRSMNKIES